jgi:hypothetical protein
MADLVNPTVITPGGMGMMGGAGYNSGGLLGGGGDGIGALLIGALLFGGGLGGGFGRNGLGTGVGAVDGVVTPTHLQAALNQQTQSENTNHILQHLAQIQQLIPEGTAAVQLAVDNSQIALANQAAQGQLAAANSTAQIQLQAANNTTLLQNDVLDSQNDLNKSIAMNALNNANSFAATQMAVAGSTASINQTLREVKDVAEAGFAAGQLSLANVHSSTLQNFAALSLQACNNTGKIVDAVRDDGDRTRSLIIAQNDAYLNRIIVEQANALTELKNERHTKDAGITLQQTVNQAQNQNQAQQQQQQQFQILGQIAASLNGLTQIAHATNQNVIAGNTGAVTTGAQTASPVNVA